MPKRLRDWLENDVQPYRDKSVSWISQFHFFRDPIRPTYSGLSYFFSPADGIILYQHKLHADQCLVEIKGRSYSLRDAIRDRSYQAESLVIGIFMTFFDVHTNRIPYPGSISYTELEPVDTYNHPMLDVEKASFRIFASLRTRSTIFITTSASSTGFTRHTWLRSITCFKSPTTTSTASSLTSSNRASLSCKASVFPKFATARRST